MRTLLLTVMTVTLALFPALCHAAPTVKPADGERLLLIHSATGATTEKEVLAQSAVYDSIVEYLTDLGYRVVDRKAAEQASLQIAVTHEIDPVLNRAASYGLKFLAEYTIHYKTSTLIKDPEKGTGALVRASAKIIDNTGARILTAKSSEASSTGHTPEDAITKAAASAGKKLAIQLTRSLDRHVSQNGSEGRSVTMVIEGREQSVSRIFTMLERSSHVAAIKELEAGGGKTTLELVCKVRRDQLEREMIKLASQQGINLTKVRSEGNRSTWKIR